jgi:hypothetical protein
MKKVSIIIFFAILGIIALFIFLYFMPPAGIESKGETVTIAYISLAVAIVSFLTSLLGLIQKIIELRTNANSK